MKHLSSIFRIAILGMAMLCATGATAQSREYIRKAIEKWGECRNVALTETQGDLALYGDNGYAHFDCPKDLDKAITGLHADGEYIDDVQLTEKGSWLIQYGENGCVWSNIPASLEKKIKEFNNEGEVITSITFNDEGDWIIITTEHYAASDNELQQWLKEGNEEYGQIWAACLTNDAAVAVYEEGYHFTGNVPQSLQKALSETDLDVYRLKISGDCWFFADEEGSYQYEM